MLSSSETLRTEFIVAHVFLHLRHESVVNTFYIYLVLTFKFVDIILYCDDSVKPPSADVVLTFESKFNTVTVHMKSLQQYFHMVLQ